MVDNRQCVLFYLSITDPPDYSVSQLRTFKVVTNKVGDIGLTQEPPQYFNNKSNDWSSFSFEVRYSSASDPENRVTCDLVDKGCSMTKTI